MADTHPGSTDRAAVLHAACAMAGGDVNAALHWLKHEPLAPFNGKTAETLVSEGRAEDVIKLIESFHTGPAG